MAASLLRRLARALVPAAAPSALSAPFPVIPLEGAWRQATPDCDWHFLAFDLRWPADEYRLPHFVRQLMTPAGSVAAMHLILRCEAQPDDAMSPWLAQHLRADSALLSRMATERARGLQLAAPRQLKARLILRLALGNKGADELAAVQAHLLTMADAMGAHMAPVTEIGLPDSPAGECLELTPTSPDCRLEPVLERMIQGAPNAAWSLVTTLVPASAASIAMRHASGPRAETLRRHLEGGAWIAQSATQLQLDACRTVDKEKILTELHRGAYHPRFVTASKQPLYWPRPRQVRAWPHVVADELYARVPVLPVARRNNQPDGTPWLTPYNEVAYFSPFNSDMGYNTLMIGSAGSGMTVTLRDILTAHLAAGGQATILDAYDGYADFGKLFNAALRPCAPTLPDPLVGMSHHLFWDFEHLIVEWLCTLFSPVTDMARAAIRAGLAEAWQRHPDGISFPLLIEGLANFADKTTGPGAAAAIMLASTLGAEPPFGRCTEPTPSAPLTIYDIESVNFELRPTALATLLVIEAQKWRHDYTTPKLLVLDDIDTRYLSGNESLLAALLRTSRRYRAGVIITTRASDLYATPIGPTLLDHASHLLFFRSSPEQLETLARHHNWSPNELALYKTAQTICGREVRLVYRGPNTVNAMRVTLDPFNMSALSASTRHLAPIRKVLAQGGAPVAAVEAAMAEQRACD